MKLVQTGPVFKTFEEAMEYRRKELSGIRARVKRYKNGFSCKAAVKVKAGETVVLGTE
jgi:hypothetical protein